MGNIASSIPSDGEDTKALTDILKCNQSFTMKFYQALATDREGSAGDVCLSGPLLQLALAALLTGAAPSSKCHQALAHLLQAPPDAKSMRRGFSTLRRYLKDMKDVTMATAVGFYTPDTTTLLKDWYITLHKYYSVSIKPTNFSKPCEKLCSTVNNWVKSKTENRIDQLIPLASVNGSVQLLLICAAYFQCELDSPFNAADTTNDIFYVTPENIRIVKLMHQVNTFRYAEFDNLKCQVVELPYKNPNLHLVMLLPFSMDGLEELEGQLSNVDFPEMIKNLTETKVLVSVPSVCLQKQHNICEYLEEVGLSVIANHSERPLINISHVDPSIAVSQFNHMLRFEIRENLSSCELQGANKKAIDSDTIVFRADHPFLFAVIDTSLNMILAFGRINCFSHFTNPTLQKLARDQLEDQRKQYLDQQIQLKTQLMRDTIVIYR